MLLPSDLRAKFSAADSIDFGADAYFEMLDDLYDRFHDPADNRVHIQVSPAGGQWCSDKLILRARDWARRRNTRVQMHLLETRYQRISPTRPGARASLGISMRLARWAIG